MSKVSEIIINEEYNKKRGYWIIFIMLFLMQNVMIYLFFRYDFQVSNLPEEYHTISNWFGIAWNCIFLVLILHEMKHAGINFSKLFNFNFSTKIYLDLLKYMAFCVAAITLFQFIPSQELGLSEQSSQNILLSGISAVLIAPIFEEIIFRGYLYTVMFKNFKRDRERKIVNAMLFAFAHVLFYFILLGAPAPFYIFILGFLMAKLYDESGSVIPSIALHMFNNGLVFALEYIKQLWQGTTFT